MKPKLPAPTEHQEQAAVIRWANLHATRFHPLRLLFAIPNGGKRGIITATMMKAEGVKPGVPDLMLPIARRGYHGLFIEMKTATGKLTGVQLECIEDLTSEGYRCVVCHGAEAAVTEIKHYLGVPK